MARKTLLRKVRDVFISPAFHYLFDRPKAIDEVPPEHYLSIAACVKNEGRYLVEWIEYHLWAGVAHFYIYDNGSTDNTKEVLKPYIESGVVTYHYWTGKRVPWRWGTQQVRMYRDAVARYKHCTKWLALIDADEFIALSDEGKRQFGCTGGGLIRFFEQHESSPAVCINWLRFDGGGHEAMPKSGYVIENYTRTYKEQDVPANRFIKTIVQPLEVRYCGVHVCVYKRFRKAVDESGKPLRGLWGTIKINSTATNSTQIIRINHYYSKSKEEFIEKISVRKYAWRSDKQQGTYSEGAWNYPEWKHDNVMQEATAALRAKGVPETYGG